MAWSREARAAAASRWSLRYRTYAVTEWMEEAADAMNRASGVSWGCSDHHDSGRLGHGVAPLSYDAAALRPSQRRLADAAGAGRCRGQPDAVRPDRGLCDRLVAARCPAESDAHQPGLAGAGARCAQPPAAHPPALDPRPA